MKRITLYIGQLKDFFLGFFSYVKENQSRTLLASSSIVFGMCVLTLLLAVGDGMEKSSIELMSDFSTKSVWFYGGTTSELEENDNIKEGKAIMFDKELIAELQKKIDGIRFVTPELTADGKIASTSDKNAICTQKRVGVNFFQIKNEKVNADGRFFNYRDQVENRKVCVIGKNIQEILFPGEEAVGKYLKLDHQWFKVIGVIKPPKTAGESDTRIVYIPYFTTGEPFSKFGILVDKDKSAVAVENQISEFLAKKLGFKKTDKSALYVMNFEKQNDLIVRFFDQFNGFNWFIGICLLVVAIIGCTNILVVIIKERTAEIGIRKAIGANPKNILQMMLFESLIVILISGIFGVMIGHILVEIANFLLSVGAETEEDQILATLVPNDFGTYLSLVILVFIGTLGSILPAIRASRIDPITAINQN